MKIRNTKSIMLFRRCLATRELESYAGLCSVMEDFRQLALDEDGRIATIDDPEIIPLNRISQLLNKYMPYLLKNDLSFMNESAFKYDLASFQDRFLEERIRKNLKDYAKHYKNYSEYRHYDSKFKNCVKRQPDGSVVIDRKEFKEFESSIPHYSNFGDFYHHFLKHSPTYLGHEHYMLAQQAQNKINFFQPKSSKELFSELTPETFGANIKGFKTPEKLTAKLSEFEDKKPSELKEDIYTSTLGKVYTAPKGTFKKMLAILLLITSLTAGSITYANNIDDYEKTTISSSQDLGVSNNTFTLIKKARTLLNELKNKDGDISTSEFDELRDLLDDNMDLIFSDLVKKGVEKKHPDWNVTNVETYYDTFKETKPYSISFSYNDKKGNVHKKTITDFNDDNFLQMLFGKKTTIKNTFKNEYALDTTYNSLITNYKNANSPEELKKAKEKILLFLEEIQLMEESAAGKTIHFEDRLFEKSLGFDLSKTTTTRTTASDQNETNYNFQLSNSEER